MTTDPLFREALAVHEALRRLGFSADDIYIARYRHGEVQMHLRTQGLEFTYDCGTTEMSPEAMLAAWEAAAGEWNKVPPAEIDRALDESFVGQNFVNLLVILKMKGFVLPSVAAAEAAKGNA